MRSAIPTRRRSSLTSTSKSSSACASLLPPFPPPPPFPPKLTQIPSSQPLNLTHTALFTQDIHSQLLQPSTVTYDPSLSLPPASTPLRHTLSTNLIFFAEAYKAKYGFSGPPLHDALTVAYISHPELFQGKRYRVDVVTEGLAAGATIVDLWEYQKATVDQAEGNWGRTGKNVLVLEKVEVGKFWEVFLEAVVRADAVCPINQK